MFFNMKIINKTVLKRFIAVFLFGLIFMPDGIVLSAEIAADVSTFNDISADICCDEYFEHQELQVAKKKTPAPTGNVSIIIDTFRRKLIVLNDNITYAQFPIAIGKAETPSPIGNWKVISKRMNWGSGFGTRWLGLNVPWGIYGIHGTNKPWSIGSMASHGCFRMWNENVEIIYPWIKNNTSVTVIGNPFGYMSGGMQTLNNGDKGAAVYYVQEKLKRLGFYEGRPDGIFGLQTEKAVLNLQEYYKLTKTGQIGFREYAVLKLW